MQSDYMAIFKDIFYDVQQDEEMNEVIQESCELIGSVVVKPRPNLEIMIEF